MKAFRVVDRVGCQLVNLHRAFLRSSKLKPWCLMMCKGDDSWMVFQSYYRRGFESNIYCCESLHVDVMPEVFTVNFEYIERKAKQKEFMGWEYLIGFCGNENYKWVDHPDGMEEKYKGGAFPLRVDENPFKSLERSPFHQEKHDKAVDRVRQKEGIIKARRRRERMEERRKERARKQKEKELKSEAKRQRENKRERAENSRLQRLAEARREKSEW